MQFEEDKAPIDKDEDAEFSASSAVHDDDALALDDDDIDLADDIPLLGDDDDDEVDHSLGLRDDI